MREEAKRRGVGAAFGLLSGMVQTVRERAWDAYRATEAKLGRTEEREKPSCGEQRHPSFRRLPYPDPETADISEAERRRAYLASAEYQQRRQKLVEWEQRQRAWWQWLHDLWYKRSVRIRLAAAAVRIASFLMPPFSIALTGLALDTYLLFHASPVAWFGVGGDQRGVEIALSNRQEIAAVVENYNAALASETTFICAYNQKGKPKKECVRSVEIQPILVEAAIAVQSQWKILWLDSSLLRWIQGQEHSSEGIAQVSQPELEQWADNLRKYLPPGASLSPQDVHASAGAVIERIAPVLEYCQQQKCDPNSQVIVAAMAQNGEGFTVETLQSIYEDERKQYHNLNGSINWEEYFADQSLRPIEGDLFTRFSRLVQNLRALPGNFERQFMLQLYVNDLKLLQAKGETLPEGVDLKYLECLADRLPGASYHCGNGD